MAGYLYAVIFEQGTVKVGMSETYPKHRIVAAINESRKWSLAVHRELMAEYETPDVPFRELALCGFCRKDGQPVGGYEWFKFKTAEFAEERLLAYFEMIGRNEFGTPQCRNTYDNGKAENDKKFSAAMVLIKQGIPARQAANMVDAHHMVVIGRKEYQKWQWATDLAAVSERVVEVQTGEK